MVAPFCSNWAVFGTKAARDLMLSRARPEAKPSRSSPTRNSTTTTAASSAAPISTAPTAAIVISISIVNGDPARAAAQARRAIGIRPTASASTIVAVAIPVQIRPATYAKIRAAPQINTSRVLSDDKETPPPAWL